MRCAGGVRIVQQLRPRHLYSCSALLAGSLAASAILVAPSAGAATPDAPALRPALDVGAPPEPAVEPPPQADTGNPPARDFTTYHPTVRATRIALSEAPKIDGDLSDPVWQKGQPITEFYQIDP